MWALLCTPWFIGGRVIPWDAKNHFYPMLRFLAAALHQGESASWAPYHFSGHPQLADVRAGQAVVTHAGEWVRYSTPEPEGAEYVAICIPAFSMDTVHRDE